MTAIQIVLILGVVIYVIARRLAGEPIQAMRLVVFPAVIAVIGGYQLSTALHGQLTAITITLVVFEALVGFALGLVRGLTIQVYENGGHLWYRYRPATIAVWIGSVLIRVGIVVAAHLLGAGATGSAILLMLGLSLLGEAAVVGSRALRSGVPFAPGPRAGRLAGTATGRRRYR